MALLRLDKLIADTGRATRSEARDLIRAGRVTVDGAVVRSPDSKFAGAAVRVCIDSQPVDYAAYRYIMMNKPAGVLSACEDSRQQTVLDLLSPELRRQGLSPVGRLDKDTTGLLLLTNDGDFSHRITSPKKHLPKLYRATVDKPAALGDAEAFEKGIVLADGFRCLPAHLEAADDDECAVLVTLYEGKFHQVKRMFEAVGLTVTELHRETFGPLTLPEDLPEGQWRELTEKEMADLYQAAQMEAPQ